MTMIQVQTKGFVPTESVRNNSFLCGSKMASRRPYSVLKEGKKINYINEPAQLRINPINQPLFTSDWDLSPRISPSPFTVPSYLSVLRGQCFNKVIGDYRYNLCPFQNATQYEQSFRWNPYKGIIGIWKEWKINSNELKEMIMPDGDSCGEKWRQTRVKLVCSQDNSADAHIMTVEEPATCDYFMTVGTHLVCFNYSLNVYPFLTPVFQEMWNELEGKYLEDELTEKGYKVDLHMLLTEAKFLLSDSEEEARWRDAQVTKTEAAIQPANMQTTFISLSDCNQDYLRLTRDLESLQRELAMLKNSSVVVHP